MRDHEIGSLVQDEVDRDQVPGCSLCSLCEGVCAVFVEVKLVTGAGYLDFEHTLIKPSRCELAEPAAHEFRLVVTQMREDLGPHRFGDRVHR